MTFKVGDKVRVIPQEQKFYRDMYDLTSTIGTINRTGENCTYVIFKTKITPFEFAFMEEVKNAI